MGTLSGEAILLYPSKFLKEKEFAPLGVNSVFEEQTSFSESVHQTEKQERSHIFFSLSNHYG